MQNGPPPHRQDFDFVKEIAKEIQGKKDLKKNNNSNPLGQCPHIHTKTGQQRTLALLDTGSQVTAVSDTFYRVLLSEKEVRELPVSNLMVSTAVGKKATPIKRQILIEIEVDNMLIENSFLVIPHLTSDMILGNDWMARNNAIIDYKTMSIEIRGKRLAQSSMAFERGASETLFCIQKDKTVYVYVLNSHELSILTEIGAQEDENPIKIIEIDNNSEISVIESSEVPIVTKLMEKTDEIENSQKDVPSQEPVKSQTITRINIETGFGNKTPGDCENRMRELYRGIDTETEKADKVDGSEHMIANQNERNNNNNGESGTDIESQYGRKEKKKGILDQEQEEKETFAELMIREISNENKQGNWSNENVELYSEQEVLCDLQTIVPKLTSLNETQKCVFKKMLEKFPHLFSDKPGCSKGYEHKIKLNTH